MPGTYVLAADLTCPRVDVAITIRPPANGVHLDLANHTINGLGTSTSPVNGLDGVTGLRVTGGTLTGFSTGIELVGCEDCQIVGSRTNVTPPNLGGGAGGG